MPLSEATVLAIQKRLSDTFSTFPDVMQQIQLEALELVAGIDAGHDCWVKLLLPWATQRAKTLVSLERQRQSRLVSLDTQGGDQGPSESFGDDYNTPPALQVAPTQDDRVHLRELRDELGEEASLVGQDHLNSSERGRLFRKRKTLEAAA
jgi:hypothetical protein